jgi:beta-phosphoglucomutase-like phosphatase (HAD superfamily)
LQGGPFSTAFWDFDGVLGDTEPIHEATYATLLRGHGREPRPGFFQPLVGKTEDAIWSLLVREYKLSESVSSLKAERMRLFMGATDGLEPSWFVRPLADALVASKTVQVLLSSGGAEVISHLLARWGLLPYFSVVLANSPETRLIFDKPSALAQALTSHPAALVIEDNLAYLRVARSLGAHTVGVRHSLNEIGTADADYILNMKRPKNE